MWQHFFWCLSKFKEMLKDTGLFKSTKSVPMAGLYGNILVYTDWRTTTCIRRTLEQMGVAAEKMNCPKNELPEK
jgi:hypothetical protein